MKILLCCNAGLSTNMLMGKMKQIVKNSKVLNEEDFSFNAVSADMIEQYIDDFDIVLVGPQVGHMMGKIKAICEPKNKPCRLIDPNVYGDMDGATVLKMALVEVKKKELNKK